MLEWGVLWTEFFNYFGQTPRIIVAGSYVKIVISNVRNYQAVIQSGCTILHSHQQWMKTIASHPHQNLVLSVSGILAILISVFTSITVILMWSSLMTYDVVSFHMLIYYLSLPSIYLLWLGFCSHLQPTVCWFAKNFWYARVFLSSAIPYLLI